MLRTRIYIIIIIIIIITVYIYIYMYVYVIFSGNSSFAHHQFSSGYPEQIYEIVFMKPFLAAAAGDGYDVVRARPEETIELNSFFCPSHTLPHYTHTRPPRLRSESIYTTTTDDLENARCRRRFLMIKRG